MYNNAELDAVKARYFEEGARPSVSTLMYLRDEEVKEARQKLITEQERIKAEYKEKEKLLNEHKEQDRLREIQRRKSTLPYSDALAQEICERLSCGELLINVCNDDHLPTMRRCNQWLRKHEDFNFLYKESLNDRLNIFEEEVIKIADDASHDFKEVVRNGVKVRVLDGEAIARAKLRVEVRFRHLKAGRPQKWGDSTTLNVKTADQNDPSNLSLDELEAKIADIEITNCIVRSAA